MKSFLYNNVRYLRVVICIFILMLKITDVFSQNSDEQKVRVVPDYIRSNSHPKQNPLLNDSTSASNGTILLLVEGNAKEFVDPMGYVISIIENPMVHQVHFTPEKSWLIVDENVDVAALEVEWLKLVRTPLKITSIHSNISSPPTKE